MEFRVVPHHFLPGVSVIEVWEDGQFLATLTPGKGGELRVISKHGLGCEHTGDMAPGVLLVRIMTRTS